MKLEIDGMAKYMHLLANTIPAIQWGGLPAKL